MSGRPLPLSELVANAASFVGHSFSNRPDGQKKAYVRLSPDYEAADVANKLGII